MQLIRSNVNTKMELKDKIRELSGNLRKMNSLTKEWNFIPSKIPEMQNVTTQTDLKSQLPSKVLVNFSPQASMDEVVSSADMREKIDKCPSFEVITQYLDKDWP